MITRQIKTLKRWVTTDKKGNLEEINQKAPGVWPLPGEQRDNRDRFGIGPTGRFTTGDNTLKTGNKYSVMKSKGLEAVKRRAEEMLDRMKE